MLREADQKHADLLGSMVPLQVEVAELRVTAENSKALGVKLSEVEGELAAKTEALNLLQADHDKFQAEVNKLQVEKEFLEKQLATKDSKIEELEKANQGLQPTIWLAPSMKGSRRLWPKPHAKTQGSILPTVTLAIISSTGRWCPSTLGKNEKLLFIFPSL